MGWDNVISRTFWLVIQPSNLLGFLLLLGIILVWTGRRTSGMTTLLSCFIFYLLVMFGPLTEALLVPLEERFSRYSNVHDNGPYSGIIVLGGAEQLTPSTFHDQVTLSGAGERLIEAAKLARLFPHLPLIYCGGGQSDGMISEAAIARKFFREAGIDLNRIRFDTVSYNTYGNAQEAKKIITPSETGKWLLVTSAFHMPRAVGAFRSAQINIQPYPVDYRTDLIIDFLHKPNTGEGLYELDYAVHEWVGLLGYYLRGYHEDLFPAP